MRGLAQRAAEHHAAAQLAVGAEDVARALDELQAARHDYTLAGDLAGMAPVLDALQVPALTRLNCAPCAMQAISISVVCGPAAVAAAWVPV